MNFPLNHSTPGNSLGFFFSTASKVFPNVADKYYKSKKALKETSMTRADRILAFCKPQKTPKQWIEEFISLPMQPLMPSEVLGAREEVETGSQKAGGSNFFSGFSPIAVRDVIRLRQYISAEPFNWCPLSHDEFHKELYCLASDGGTFLMAIDLWLSYYSQGIEESQWKWLWSHETVCSFRVDEWWDEFLS